MSLMSPNLLDILSRLEAQGSLTTTEVAHMSGLVRSQTFGLLYELSGKGWVGRAAVRRGRGSMGRPPVTWEILPLGRDALEVERAIQRLCEDFTARARAVDPGEAVHSA